MPELDGKTALITGAGSGIGREIANLFAEEGASLALADINFDAAEELRHTLEASGASAMAVAVDMRDEGAVEKNIASVEAHFGRLDIAVHCAGIRGGRMLIPDLTAEEWHRVIETNLTGTFNLLKHVIPAMTRAGGGSIITFGSITAQKAETGHAVYGVAKAGVTLLSKVAAIENAGAGIRVNCLAPGYVDTPMILEFTEGSAVRQSFVKNLQPIRRLVTTREVAETALFLASDRAAAMTGAVIALDGGLSAI